MVGPWYCIRRGMWRFGDHHMHHGNPQPSFLGVITHILGVQNLHFSRFWGRWWPISSVTPVRTSSPRSRLEHMDRNHGKSRIGDQRYVSNREGRLHGRPRNAMEVASRPRGHECVGRKLVTLHQSAARSVGRGNLFCLFPSTTVATAATLGPNGQLHILDGCWSIDKVRGAASSLPVHKWVFPKIGVPPNHPF